MRQGVYFLFVLGLSVLIGLFLAHVPAFMLLEIGRFSIAVPLWLLFIFVLMISGLLLIMRRIVRRVVIVPQKLRSNLELLRQRQKVRRKIEQIELGIKRASKAQLE